MSCGTIASGSSSCENVHQNCEITTTTTKMHYTIVRHSVREQRHVITGCERVMKGGRGRGARGEAREIATVDGGTPSGPCPVLCQLFSAGSSRIIRKTKLQSRASTHARLNQAAGCNPPTLSLGVTRKHRNKRILHYSCLPPLQRTFIYC